MDRLTRPINPSPRPNQRLSAPYQYGRPWTWKQALILLVVFLGVMARIVQKARW